MAARHATAATVAAHIASASTDDRLAASYPFLTMLATAVAGWLMERQGLAAAEGKSAFHRMKSVIARFYLDQLVPEALGLKAAASAPAQSLFALDAVEMLA
jgi:hypothetical protein